MADFRTLTEMVKAAKQNLSKGDWDYLTGAADSEASLRRNRAAVESWVFRPRILNKVDKTKYDYFIPLVSHKNMNFIYKKLYKNNKNLKLINLIPSG